jgi:hypothetical protein
MWPLWNSVWKFLEKLTVMMMMVTIIMGHERILGNIWGDQWEGERKDSERWRGLKYSSYLCEDSIMNPTKHCLKRGEEKMEWKHNREAELVQSLPYVAIITM